MSIEKEYIQKPSVIESQQEINDANSRLDELRDLHARGDISYQHYDDEEQLAAISRARAEGEREEAVDRQTGRKVGMRTKFRRSVSKLLFG
jgi:hypothetical protein